MQILLIEDNPDDVETFRHFLQEAGGETYTLNWADSLEPGLALLKEGGADVVVLDLSLPDSQGLETFTKIRTCAPFMPVVVLTGQDDEQLGLQIVEQGAQDYLVKGELDAKLLSRAIRYARERSRSEHTIRCYAQKLEAKNKELLEARDQAMESNRVKDRFLATISHEFRTPMNGVLGMNDLLLGTDLNSEQREYAELLHQSADILLRILNDILEFTQMVQNGPQPTQENFDLKAMMQHVLAPHADQAREKGLVFELVIQDDISHGLRGDPEQLGQILGKLVDNAIKFTTDGSVAVHVTAVEETATDVFLRFSITDTGFGIVPEKQTSLFQPFNQVDNSSSRAFDGIGLSLAICKNLVEKMGGEIGFSSQEGCGSEFWFTVRLAKTAVSYIETSTS